MPDAFFQVVAQQALEAAWAALFLKPVLNSALIFQPPKAAPQKPPTVC
jgi:hypothetical protein